MARSIRSYFAGLSRSTFLLAAASLFADISTEMLYPVLPVFLAQTLKANGNRIAELKHGRGGQVLPVGLGKPPQADVDLGFDRGV